MNEPLLERDLQTAIARLQEMGPGFAAHYIGDGCWAIQQWREHGFAHYYASGRSLPQAVAWTYETWRRERACNGKQTATEGEP